jgi:hypothetical protein
LTCFSCIEYVGTCFRNEIFLPEKAWPGTSDWKFQPEKVGISISKSIFQPEKAGMGASERRFRTETAGILSCL